MQQRQPLKCNEIVSVYVRPATPPRLSHRLLIPDKVKQFSEKVEQWVLWNLRFSSHDQFYRDRQMMLNQGKMLDYFLAFPDHFTYTQLPENFERNHNGRFSFISMNLFFAQSYLDEEKETSSITCVSDQEGHWITITVINTILLFRLEMLGFRILCRPTDIKAKVVYSILRNYKEQGKILKQGSEFLKALTEKGCIVMHRDQAIYPWASVQHGKLLKKVIEHAYKLNKHPDTRILHPLWEPALSLMASTDVKSLNRTLEKII